MACTSILVNIDIDGPVAPIVKLGIALARAHKARLIGLCAADSPMPFAGPDMAGAMADAWLRMREVIEGRLKTVQDEFESLTAGLKGAEWRQELMSPTRAVVEAARSADLIVMAAVEGAATGNPYRVADPGSVVLRAGRPLLSPARNSEQLRADKIVVAWKDTREARRAVADALPFLAAAKKVEVVAVAPQIDEHLRSSVNDVIAFLASHGIAAKPELIAADDESVALLQFVEFNGAGLVVSGAYGHSRLREWAFGGMTRSLLDETNFDRFMSS